MTMSDSVGGRVNEGCVGYVFKQVFLCLVEWLSS